MVLRVLAISSSICFRISSSCQLWKIWTSLASTASQLPATCPLQSHNQHHASHRPLHPWRRQKKKEIPLLAVQFIKLALNCMESWGTVETWHMTSKSTELSTTCHCVTGLISFSIAIAFSSFSPSSLIAELGQIQQQLVIQTTLERCYVLHAACPILQKEQRHISTHVASKKVRFRHLNLPAAFASRWSLAHMSQSTLKQPALQLVSDARKNAASVAACLNIPTLADWFWSFVLLSLWSWFMSSSMPPVICSATKSWALSVSGNATSSAS